MANAGRLLMRRFHFRYLIPRLTVIQAIAILLSCSEPTQEETPPFSSTEWARSVTSASGHSGFKSVAVSGSDSIYAAGYMYGTEAYELGNGIDVAGYYSDYNALLVKYNSTGAAQWAATAVLSSVPTLCNSVAVDAAGNVIVAGCYDGGVLLSKLNSSGIEQWFNTSTLGTCYFTAVTVDSSGNVYAVGEVEGYDTCDFGDGVTAKGAFASNDNVLLVKYNSSGTAQWARSVVSASNSSYFYSVAVDSDGNIYAAGYIEGDGSFGFGDGVTVTGVYKHPTYGSPNALLVKYDPSSTPQWALTVIAASDISPFYSVVGSSGNLYIAGAICGTGDYDFGNGVTVTAPSFGGVNGVLLKYNSSGVAQKAVVTSFFEDATAVLHSVSVSNSGDVYAAGDYSCGNAVLAKYNSALALQWFQTIASSSCGSFYKSVDVDGSGNAYAAGDISGTGSYDCGNGVTVVGGYTGNNLLLVKY